MPTSTRLLPASGRIEAFLIHLMLSLLVFGSLVAVMYRYWFPGALFWLDGGIQGLGIVAMVDLVLGPLLTLMLFRRGKPRLVLDMSLIAALQVGALAYGFATTWQQRTVAVVLADRALTTLSASAKAEADAQLRRLERTPREIAGMATGRPPLLATPAPERGRFGAYVAELLNGFPEPHERSDLFVPLAQRSADIAAASLDHHTLENLGLATAVEDARGALAASGVDDAARLPAIRYRTRFSSGVALLDPEAGEVRRYLPLPAATASASAEGGE